jgi:hypothetical protein
MKSFARVGVLSALPMFGRKWCIFVCMFATFAGAVLLSRLLVVNPSRTQGPAITGRTPQGVGSLAPGYRGFHRVSRYPLPRTISPEAFTNPRVRIVYAMAGSIRGVLDQLPCYCDCGSALGHGSLLECYVGRHASVCEVCLMEAAFAYEQTTRGETPIQIRAQLDRGAWRGVNLDKECTLFQQMSERARAGPRERVAR